MELSYNGHRVAVRFHTNHDAFDGIHVVISRAKVGENLHVFGCNQALDGVFELTNALLSLAGSRRFGCRIKVRIGHFASVFLAQNIVQGQCTLMGCGYCQKDGSSLTNIRTMQTTLWSEC